MADVAPPPSLNHAIPRAVPLEEAFTTRVPSGVWGVRIVWGLLFAMPLAVLITAALLTPAHDGLGTHTQLGLAPCGFYTWTGLPCPGCGLTTCFAHMVRGEVFDAARANSFGVFLFIVTLLSMPVSFLGVVRGLSVTTVLERLSVDKLALILAVGSISVWIVRLATIYLVF